MIKKLMTAVAACSIAFGLAACGNTRSAEQTSNSSSHSSKVVSHKKSVQQNKSSNRTQSSPNTNKNSSSSTSISAKNIAEKASSIKNSSSQMTMSAQDAKNIVKEHIGNQLNNAGIAGKPKPNVPSIDEIDGYSAVENGINNWTVSGNGHTYHVTTTSVTGN